MPHMLWKKIEDERMGKKVGTQGTLDGLLKKSTGPIMFTCENVLHAVTQFVAVDDQVIVLTVKNKHGQY
jgi:hypothetical protein